MQSRQITAALSLCVTPGYRGIRDRIITVDRKLLGFIISIDA